MWTPFYSFLNSGFSVFLTEFFSISRTANVNNSFFSVYGSLIQIQRIHFFLLLFLLLVFFSIFSVLWLEDLLLIFLGFDLLFTLIGCIFAAVGIIYQETLPILFFFTILVVVACESAIALGLLVSFGRSGTSTALPNLQYTAL